MAYHAGDDRAAHVDRCVCGHNGQRHAVPGFDGECIAESCTCKVFRSVTGVTVAAGPRVAPTPVTVEQVVRVAKAFGDKRARLVADRVEHLVDELKGLLAADRAKTRADHTATQIAQLPGPAKPATGGRGGPRVSQPKTCPDCGKTCGSGQGLAAHRRNTHTVQPVVQCPDCAWTGVMLAAHRVKTHGQRKAAS